MAVSLKEYKPAASELKRLHNTSVGGTSKTTKFPVREQPARASITTQSRYKLGWALEQKHY